MSCLFSCYIVRYLFTCIVFLTVTPGLLIGNAFNPCECAVAGDWIFAANIIKMSENMISRAKKKDYKKTLELMRQIRSEVENYRQQRINLAGCYDAVVRDLKADGYQLTNKEYLKIWDLINGPVKKAGIGEYDYPLDELRNGEVHDTDIPITVQVGVAIALAGYFLTFIPIPQVTTAGWAMVTAGTTMAGQGLCSRMDHDQDIKRDEEIANDKRK